MHHQLEILLELQDLKAQQRDLEEAAEEHSHDIERKVFRVKPKDAVVQLSATIEKMERSLDAEIRKRYNKIAGRRPRPVVPVLNGICYGCFMAVPTATDKTNEEIRWCEQCGSFIYFVD